MAKTRWYRNPKEGKFGGVCAGLSEMLDVDVTLVRVLWFCLIWTPFPAFLGYVIAWFIVPTKEELNAINNPAGASTTDSTSSNNKEFLAG